MARHDDPRETDPAPGDFMPDPSDVFTRAGLTRHLARLRERGPGSRPAPRVGLTALARRAGIPRSTLHTYLSGQTFPPADALDAIVLALGCSGPQTRAWAAAWERVADASRDDLAPSRSPHWSVLQHIHRGTSEWVEETLHHRQSDFDTIAIIERAHIGRHRRIEHVDMRITARARRAGLDRWVVFVPASPDMPHPELIDATALDRCRIGAGGFHEGQSVAVVEIVLEDTLEKNEVTSFEFRLHHGHASSHAAELWGPSAAPWSYDVRRGFPQAGPFYSLEVGFDSPNDVTAHQSYQDGPEAPTELVRPLKLTRTGSVSIALEHPAPGMHGIIWTWECGSQPTG